MKSRRRIGFPKTHDRVSMSSQRKRSNQKFAPSEMGSMVCLRSSNLAPRMSLEGQKQTKADSRAMSARPLNVLQNYFHDQNEQY
jgi:hypothetical protein